MMKLLRKSPLGHWIGCVAVLLGASLAMAETFRDVPREQPTFAAYYKSLGKSLTQAANYASSAEELGRKVTRDAFVRRLARHELLRVMGTEVFDELRGTKEGKKFLADFLGDKEWMTMLLCSGPLGKEPAKVLQKLCLLWNDQPTCRSKKLYRVLATAIAIQAAGSSDKEVIGRYRYFYESHRMKKLNPIFDKLEVWEMRYVASASNADGSLTWLRDNVNMPLHRHGGACWQVAYKRNNDFGDSIHGPLYYRPWSGKMPKWEMVRRTGGVCGSLSTYATYVARAHGIPASPMGQPGHCAYTYRSQRGRWHACYSINWPSALKQSFWGGYWDLLYLMEDVFADAKKVEQSNASLWLANLLKNSLPQKARWAYENALATHPKNYDAWNSYIVWLGKQPTTAPQWDAIYSRVIEQFSRYPNGLYNLVGKFEKAATAKLTDAQKLAWCKRLHKGLVSVRNADRYHWDRFVKRQLDLFKGNRKLQFDAYRAILESYIAMVTVKDKKGKEQQKPSDHMNRYFWGGLSWGQRHFGRYAELQQPFCRMLLELAEEHGKKYGEGFCQRIYQQGILASCQFRKPELFASLSRKAWDDCKGIRSDRYRHLHARHLKAMPKLPAVSGDLISPKALLEVERASKYNRPMLYYRALGKEGGFLQTNKGSAPRITLTFTKPVKISDIVLVSRFEHKGEKEYLKTMKILIPADKRRRKWKPIFEADGKDVKGLWHVPGKDVTTQYLRIELKPEKSSLLCLRNILVYGKEQK